MTNAPINESLKPILDIDGEGAREVEYRVAPHTSQEVFIAMMNPKCLSWQRNIQIHLSEHSIIHVHCILISLGSQRLELALQLTHGAFSTSRISVHGVAMQKSYQKIHGKIVIPSDARGSDANLSERIIMLDPGAYVDAVPDLEIANQDVKATHAASVGRVSEEQLFYLRTRGLSLMDARRMIVEGLLLDELQKFPLDVRGGLINQLQRPYEQSSH